jgi:cytidyltransferase-like protein
MIVPSARTEPRVRNVLVIGVFDLFHRGHVEMLQRAKALGERLDVVVNGDGFTARYKRRPVISEEDRLAVVRACRHVDHAELAHGADARPFIERFRSDLIVHGDDWAHDSYLRQICVTEAYLRSRGVRVVYTPYYPAESTSAIIRRIGALVTVET